MRLVVSRLISLIGKVASMESYVQDTKSELMGELKLNLKDRRESGNIKADSKS